MAAPGACDYAALCEDVAVHVERGDWQRARRTADAALLGDGGHAVAGEDDKVRWLAQVWAKGAWEGGCIAECSRALRLARGLEIAVVRERRQLVGRLAGRVAEIEEEAGRAALDGNQLCCEIVLGVRYEMGSIDPSPAHMLEIGARQRGGGGIGSGGGGGGGSATSGVARLTLKKHLLELGRLVEACAQRTVQLYRVIEGACDETTRPRVQTEETAGNWNPEALTTVSPLLEVVLALCCNYCSACSLAGLSPGCATGSGPADGIGEDIGGGSGVIAFSEAARVVESVLELMASVSGARVRREDRGGDGVEWWAGATHEHSEQEGAKRRKVERTREPRREDGGADGGAGGGGGGAKGMDVYKAALSGWKILFGSEHAPVGAFAVDGMQWEGGGGGGGFVAGGKGVLLSGCEVCHICKVGLCTCACLSPFLLLFFSVLCSPFLFLVSLSVLQVILLYCTLQLVGRDLLKGKGGRGGADDVTTGVEVILDILVQMQSLLEAQGGGMARERGGHESGEIGWWLKRSLEQGKLEQMVAFQVRV